MIANCPITIRFDVIHALDKIWVARILNFDPWSGPLFWLASFNAFLGHKFDHVILDTLNLVHNMVFTLEAIFCGLLKVIDATLLQLNDLPEAFRNKYALDSWALLAFSRLRKDYVHESPVFLQVKPGILFDRNKKPFFFHQCLWFVDRGYIMVVLLHPLELSISQKRMLDLIL